MPYLRLSSDSFTPALASFKIAMICSCLNLVPRIVSLLFFGFYHAGTLITSGTVFGGKVKRSEANEVLYKPAISNAIKQGDSDELGELLQEPAAQRVCNNYIKDEVVNLIDLEGLTTASSAFSDFSYKECMPHIRRCIWTLAGQLKNIDKEQFKINNASLGEIDAADLIRFMEFDPEIIPVLINKFSVRMTKDDFGEAAPEQINKMLDAWVTVVISVLEYIRDNRDNTDHDPTINLSLAQPEQYVQLLDIVQKKKKDILKYFCPIKKHKNEYLKEYLKNIEAGNINTKDIDIVEGILNMSCIEDGDEKMIVESLTKSYTNMKTDPLLNLYHILYSHKKEKCFSDKLALLANNGQAFNLLPKLNGQWPAAAWCFINIFNYKPTPDFEETVVPANTIQFYNNLLDNMPDDLANEIVKTIAKYEIFEEICNSLDSKIKEKEGWGKILRLFAKDDKSIENISSQRFIKALIP